MYFKELALGIWGCQVWLQQHVWTLETVILSEGSQIEKDKYHVISFIYGILNNDTDENI